MQALGRSSPFERDGTIDIYVNEQHNNQTSVVALIAIEKLLTEAKDRYRTRESTSCPHNYVGGGTIFTHTSGVVLAESREDSIKDTLKNCFGQLKVRNGKVESFISEHRVMSDIVEDSEDLPCEFTLEKDNRIYNLGRIKMETMSDYDYERSYKAAAPKLGVSFVAKVQPKTCASQLKKKRPLWQRILLGNV